MKAKVILITIFALAYITQGCKKDSAKPKPTTSISKPLTINQSLSGKWYFVKDTVVATDFNTPIVFPQRYSFIGKFDYLEFTADSAAKINEQIGHDAMMTNFIKFYVNPDHPDTYPPYIYKYKASAADSTLSFTGSDASGGYAIKKLTTDSLVLFIRTEITKYPHDYRFNQYIRFSR
ncbi:hypothetical protein [Mucilaginibacter sp.]|uniref:hypothetical protein n=1 Tax=Mucilaginibacter sp. TaxID=1882438 RepID=UPI003D14E9A7